ncbi:uncharacterized protein JCM10292_007643 [Rhodotorula paludigena]|uniref:uncharacterized protein n=1 Tax=Rhodotorula paludigena TaxID=86838 RepID=UPI00317E632D
MSTAVPTAAAPDVGGGTAATTSTPVATSQGGAAGGGGGDALDKGISSILKKSGHAQSNSTVEKISDGARSLFKKLTGKDAPIKDQEMR